MKPTPAQIKYRNRKWAEALEKNENKATDQMRDNDGGRCCLQVAEDVAIAMGLDVPRSKSYASSPSYKVKRFFGWEATNPALIIESREVPDGIASASSLNDGSFTREFSHKEIAECVLNTFCRVKKPVWKLVK